jgi:hypothetical protein
VDGKISFLNTDLDLVSADDLSPLAKALEAACVFPMHVTRGADGLWYAMFETQGERTEPEPCISVMLSAIESLPPAHRSTWDHCTLREFNIGYDCGDEPWAFNQGLSVALLGRMAAVGASLRVTLYPDREPANR